MYQVKCCLWFLVLLKVFFWFFIWKCRMGVCLLYFRLFSRLMWLVFRQLVCSVLMQFIIVLLFLLRCIGLFCSISDLGRVLVLFFFNVMGEVSWWLSFCLFCSISFCMVVCGFFICCLEKVYGLQFSILVCGLCGLRWVGLSGVFELQVSIWCVCMLSNLVCCVLWGYRFMVFIIYVLNVVRCSLFELLFISSCVFMWGLLFIISILCMDFGMLRVGIVFQWLVFMLKISLVKGFSVSCFLKVLIGQGFR